MYMEIKAGPAPHTKARTIYTHIYLGGFSAPISGGARAVVVAKLLLNSMHYVCTTRGHCSFNILNSFSLFSLPHPFSRRKFREDLPKSPSSFVPATRGEINFFFPSSKCVEKESRFSRLLLFSYQKCNLLQYLSGGPTFFFLPSSTSFSMRTVFCLQNVICVCVRCWKNENGGRVSTSVCILAVSKTNSLVYLHNFLLPLSAILTSLYLFLAICVSAENTAERALVFIT